MNSHDFDEVYSETLASIASTRAEVGYQADQEEFFNYKAATADFTKWIKRPLWTVEQATALSLNKNPDIVTSHSLKGTNRFSPFRERYDQIRDLIQMAVRAKLFESEISPARFMNWALSSLEPLLPDVKDVYLHSNTENIIANPKLDSHQTKVENNILLMFGAVFCAKFGCDPFANPIPKVTNGMVRSVLNDFTILKIHPVGEDLIKRRLEEAFSRIRAHPQARVKLDGPSGKK